MAKVYRWGKYQDFDLDEVRARHDDLAYLVNGRRYKMTLCHYAEGMLRGYNTHKKKWFTLGKESVQMDGAKPVKATLIDGIF